MTRISFQALTIKDIQLAADTFRMVYEKTGSRDGYVSLEVNPHLAHDTAGTIDEARRLWKLVNRPNIFIKIPSTVEGLPAIRQCLSEGINVNVTLIFSLPRYREVAEAFLGAMEDRAQRRQSLDHVASVASFFLSRIDVLVDQMLDSETGDSKAETAARLRGEVAIASARLAYQDYKELFGGDRFARLTAWGARPQRLLWASTSPKDPQYIDMKYVEPLIGPETVNTMPMKTLKACIDHCRPESRIENDLDKARRVMKDLARMKIDIDVITQRLEDEGVEKFNAPYDHLLKLIGGKSRSSNIIQ